MDRRPAEQTMRTTGGAPAKVSLCISATTHWKVPSPPNTKRRIGFERSAYRARLRQAGGRGTEERNNHHHLTKKQDAAGYHHITWTIEGEDQQEESGGEVSDATTEREVIARRSCARDPRGRRSPAPGGWSHHPPAHTRKATPTTVMALYHTHTRARTSNTHQVNTHTHTGHTLICQRSGIQTHTRFPPKHTHTRTPTHIWSRSVYVWASCHGHPPAEGLSEG